MNGMAMYYDRRVSLALAQVIGPGGVAHSLVQRHQEASSRVDLQLRGYPVVTRCWATLYCGLTKPLDLIENSGSFTLKTHPTWREYGAGLPWQKPLSLDELAEVWREVDAYLDAVVPVIAGTRWYGKEGVVQGAVGRLDHLGMVVFDREAVPGFDDDAVKKQVMQQERELLLSALSGPEKWWSPPKIGEECDAAALDRDGRLLTIEVKPGAAGSKGMTWAPLQAAYYARLFARWAAEAVDPATSLAGMVRQREALGLAAQGSPVPSAPIQVVPMVVIGGGLPSKEVRRRCLLVRDRLLEAGTVRELDVMVLDHGALTPLTA